MRSSCPPPPAQASVHAFRGSDPLLLDAMLYSIANPSKPHANPSLCGRELTPYFGSAEPAPLTPAAYNRWVARGAWWASGLCSGREAPRVLLLPALPPALCVQHERVACVQVCVCVATSATGGGYECRGARRWPRQACLTSRVEPPHIFPPGLCPPGARTHRPCVTAMACLSVTSSATGPRNFAHMPYRGDREEITFLQCTVPVQPLALPHQRCQAAAAAVQQQLLWQFWRERSVRSGEQAGSEAQARLPHFFLKLPAFQLAP